MKKLSLIFILTCSEIIVGQNWQIPDGSMLTRWTADVNPENVLPDYPRPGFEREEWINLNGLWDYSITNREDVKPNNFDGKILVPFPVESSLSGVKRSITEAEKLWYQRSFKVPKEWSGKRILLNFGAVDWETKVWLNGTYIGEHKGGYDAFTFDITEYISPNNEQIITISVWDPTENGHQPRGKQTTDTHGFWYTAVTGIWQTVWIEPVELSCGYIKSIKTISDIDSGTLTLSSEIIDQSENHNIILKVKEGNQVVNEYMGIVKDKIKISIPEPNLWSPDHPFLYDLEIELLHDGKVVDRIKSYFGMRKIHKLRDEHRILRLALNNKILFQFGLLDQGWWPDGLYRAPTDLALKYDIEVAKSLGFNLLRKHGKMEPERWYYWCDKLGMLVWQDMTPGDIDGEYGTDRTEESKAQFELEYEQMISQLYNFPSIITWVIFNEGWGQYDTKRLVEWTKTTDATRLVSGASGFMDLGVGDLLDVHGYPGPTGAALEEQRVTTLGEFGGLGYPVKGNLWNENKAWGYVNFKSREDLQKAYADLMNELKPYISEGISAAVYTQLSDIENEINGIMTYDREVLKMDENFLKTTSLELFSISSKSYDFKSIIQDSQIEGQKWKYTNREPVKDWNKLIYNDKSWLIGEGGFGDPKDTNPVIRTKWETDEIWMRKKFTLDGSPYKKLFLKIFHQFESKTLIFLNGNLIAEAPEHSNAYTWIELDEKDKLFIVDGVNLLAVYSKQNGKRAYVDVGLFDLQE